MLRAHGSWPFPAQSLALSCRFAALISVRTHGNHFFSRIIPNEHWRSPSRSKSPWIIVLLPHFRSKHVKKRTRAIKLISSNFFTNSMIPAWSQVTHLFLPKYASQASSWCHRVKVAAMEEYPREAGPGARSRAEAMCFAKYGKLAMKQKRQGKPGKSYWG